ncbi:hypothetical protein [Rhodococcus sp. WAY2]|uniref:hypothetical protein n=1 Tax=Rhodococcus sp. WAY2 TaxID=2663121 RepID=UPI00131F5E31|nr:hypothetical protein [Rhodococcus sp. WAY2]QHE74296.1 hypothetical protein GFS60_07993 [Rhodococcus sp. WAY2]
MGNHVTEKSMYTRAYRRERRRRVVGWLLVAIGVVMGLAHVVTHLGQLHFLPSAGWQDLLLGYPMAMAIVFVGFLCIAARSRA